MNQTGELLQSVCVILNYTTNPIKYDIMHLWNKKNINCSMIHASKRGLWEEIYM